MAQFRYRAVDSEGKAVEGTMEEASAHRVTAILQERGLHVSEVRPVKERVGLPRRRERLSWEDLDLFNEQLLAIIRSGLPLAPSIRALAKDVENRRLRAVFEEVHGRLDQGATLEEALSGVPDTFSPVYLSAVRAGERSGNLAGVLSLLTAHSARMAEVKSKVQETLAYPIMVLIACAAFMGFLLIKVVPVYAEIFEDFGAGLPAPTRFWVYLSEFLIQYWPFILFVVAFTVIIVHIERRLLSRGRFGSLALDSVKLHLPLFGRVYRGNALARFSRSLGLLLASRVPIVESIELAAAAAGNAALRAAALDAARRINTGEGIAKAFRSTGFFSDSYCWFLSVGEQRGEADKTLMELAEMAERSAGRADSLIATVATPAIVMIMALSVGFLVLSMYLPIFTLGDAITGWG